MNTLTKTRLSGVNKTYVAVLPFTVRGKEQEYLIEVDAIFTGLEVCKEIVRKENLTYDTFGYSELKFSLFEVHYASNGQPYRQAYGDYSIKMPLPEKNKGKTLKMHYVAVASGKEYGIEVEGQIEGDRVQIHNADGSWKNFDGKDVCGEILNQNNVIIDQPVIAFELFHVYLTNGKLNKTFIGNYEFRNKITSESQYNDVVNSMLRNNLPIEFHNFIKNESQAVVKRLCVTRLCVNNNSQVNEFVWQQAVEVAENMIKSLRPAIQDYTKECERIARSNAAYASSDLH
jgi:hypothetical protein